MRKFLLFVLLFSCGLNQEKPVPPDNNSPAEVIVIDMSKHQSQVLAERAKALELKNKGGSVVSGDVSPIVPEKKDDSTVLTKDDPNFENSEAVKKAVRDYSTNKTPEGFAKFLKVVKEKQDFPESVGFKVEGSEPMLLLQVVVSMAMNSEMKLREEDSNAFFELFDSKLAIRNQDTDAAVLFPAIVKFLDTPEDKQFVPAMELMSKLQAKMNFADKSNEETDTETVAKELDWTGDFVAAVCDFLSSPMKMAPLSSIELFYATLAKTSDSKMDDKFYEGLVTKHDKKNEGLGLANAADLACLFVPTYTSDKMKEVMTYLSEAKVWKSESFVVTKKYLGWGDIANNEIIEGVDLNCDMFLRTLEPYTDRTYLGFGSAPLDDKKGLDALILELPSLSPVSGDVQ